VRPKASVLKDLDEESNRLASARSWATQISGELDPGRHSVSGCSEASYVGYTRDDISAGI